MVSGQLGIKPTGEGNDRCAYTPDGRQYGQDLHGLPAVGYGKNNVVARYHAQVSMGRFRGMKKKRRGPGAVQGSRDLSGDKAGLAHSR